MPGWVVYILRCSDGSLYTGITNNLERRVREHNQGGKSSAAYTRGRRPVTLVYRQACKDRSAALVKEAGIRRMSRQEKIALTGKQKNIGQ